MGYKIIENQLDCCEEIAHTAGIVYLNGKSFVQIAPL